MLHGGPGPTGDQIHCICLAPIHTASCLSTKITAVSSLLQERYCRREGPQLQALKAEQRRSHGG